MKKKILKVLGIVTVVGIALYVYSAHLSPAARARKLNIRINQTEINEEWLSLLDQLSATVPNPEKYIRYYPYGHIGAWRRKAKLDLARRLLKDKPDTLLPGIIDILHKTEPFSKDNLDLEGERSRRAACIALMSIGKEATPAMNELLEIITNDTANAQYAVQALGKIGDVRTTDVISSCFARTDLKPWVKHHALMALKLIGDASPEARKILLETMRNQDYKTRYYASIALGRLGEPSAAPVLESLLQEDFLSHEKSEISAVLRDIKRRQQNDEKGKRGRPL